MSRKRRKPYRIIGAYDSETANINDHGDIYAYPVLHQFGLLDCELSSIDSDNVEDHVSIELYRHCIDIYERFDSIADTEYEYVPVICCHNLAFDMYGLSAYLSERDNVRVLAKSCRKPITFTLQDDDGNPRLVFWDTLVFSGQPLHRMGEDCGYSKAVGEWDYDLIRTPETPLTANELEYACKDIYALIAWLAWWLKRNPDIEPEKLGINVVTKTGVVRERRKVRFDQIRGKHLKYNVGRYWHFLNKQQQPKDDDELFTMMAATRGGFTFCANRHASVPYDLEGSGKHVYAYDATSQHPSCMVSHMYPVHFHRTTVTALRNAFECIRKTKLQHVLTYWDKPFNSAFYALFEFDNIRPKKNNLYEHEGILPLASARFGKHDWELNEDNQDAQEFNENSAYKDEALNPHFLFGKLVSADKIRVYITELCAWEICQSYDFDGYRPIYGYITGRFVRPTDYSVISVMQFYKAKNVFKAARSEYYKNAAISADTAAALESIGQPKPIIDGMVSGFISDNDIDAQYLGLKADLNALFGIECSNEYRRDTVLNSYGIDYEGDFGICNAPKNPKAWYQFGQRIVGWSRIAQHCVMQLVYPHCEGVINGDTDSIKILANDADLPGIENALGTLSKSIDRAKNRIMKRVKRNYPDVFDSLDGIGHYVFEFSADRYCASWNKAYCIKDDKGYSFTIAGIPAKRGLNELANKLHDDLGFAGVCNTLLGYNVTLSYDLIGLHARKFPEWGMLLYRRVTDYTGRTSSVCECAALALYPMAKTVNSTENAENRGNCLQALANNPDVNTDDCIVLADRIVRIEDI